MSATVVNIRTGEPYDIYIGRPGKWGNPFKIGKDGSREEVIEKYRKWLLEGDCILIGQLHELVDKRLGCYCAPLPCHGDVLVSLLEQP